MSAQIVNLPLAVVEIWFFVIVNFDFRFGQEVKVKLGHFFVNICSQLTICTMVQKLLIYLLRLLRYDFLNFDFRFRQEVKVKLGSLFYQYFFDKQRSVQWCKNCEFTSCGCWDMIFLNIKLWFIVIRYLMTSSWRHKFCIISLLCSKYMPSFKFVWSLQGCVFL